MNTTQMTARLHDAIAALQQQGEIEQALTLLDVSAALLESALPVSTAAQELDFDDLYAAWVGAARQISGFAAAAHSRLGEADEAAVQEGGAQRFAALEEAVGKAAAQAQAQQRRQQELEAELTEKQEQLAQAQRRNEVLQQELVAYSPTRLQQLREQNDTLTAAIAEKKPQLAELTDRLAAAEEELHTVEERLAEIPESVRQTRQRYRESEELLEQLRQAQELYRQDKQDEMDAEISTLHPVVSGLRQSYEELRERLEALQRENTTLQEEYPRLTTEAFHTMDGVLETMTEQLEDRTDEIERIVETEQQLRRHLEQCNAQRVRYQRWLNNVETPLQAMMKLVGAAEAERLSRTLDMQQCTRVERGLRTVRQELESLERLLEQCQNALGEDTERLQERVGHRG